MLTTLQISSEELKKLNYERYHYPCPVVQKRLHSLYIKAVSGLSNKEVGKLTDAHRNSVSERVHLYQQRGIEALLKVHYGQNSSVLEEHAGSIVELLAEEPPRSIGEAMLQIQA